MRTYKDSLDDLNRLLDNIEESRADRESFANDFLPRLTQDLPLFLDISPLKGLLDRLEDMGNRRILPDEEYKAAHGAMLKHIYSLYQKGPAHDQPLASNEDQSPGLDEQLAAQNPWQGIGGPLTWLCFFLVFLVPPICLFHYDRTVSLFKELSPPDEFKEILLRYLISRNVALFGFLLVSIPTGVLLFLQKRVGLYSTVLFFLLLIAAALFEPWFVGNLQLDSAITSLFLEKTRWLRWGAVAFSVAGLVYLSTSRRVRVTYFNKNHTP